MYFILPSLPDHIKTRMEDLFARLPQEVIEKTSLDTILRKQKEFELLTYKNMESNFEKSNIRLLCFDCHYEKTN